MLFEAIRAGLRTNFEDSVISEEWNKLGEVHQSLTWPFWKILEYLLVKQPSYNPGEGDTWRLHRGQGRKIQPGQKVHASVAYCDSSYNPKASLPAVENSSRTWKDLVGKAVKEEGSGWIGGIDLQWMMGWEDLVEIDMFMLTMNF